MYEIIIFFLRLTNGLIEFAGSSNGEYSRDQTRFENTNPKFGTISFPLGPLANAFFLKKTTGKILCMNSIRIVSSRRDKPLSVDFNCRRRTCFRRNRQRIIHGGKTSLALFVSLITDTICRAPARNQNRKQNREKD